jgi:hypothetical protein
MLGDSLISTSVASAPFLYSFDNLQVEFAAVYASQQPVGEMA